MTAPQALSNTELVELAASEAADDSSREGAIRWELVREMHRRTDREIFDAAAAWCASTDPLIRTLAADTLGQFAYRDDYPFAAESAPLLDALLDDDDPSTAAAAATALGHLGAGDVEHLARLASHASSEVRESIAMALGSIGDPAAVPALVELSRDNERDVRNWAVFGLASGIEQDSPEIREALAARLDDPFEEAREEAIIGLAKRGDERAIAPIRRALADTEISRLIVEAATHLPRREFVRDLESLHKAVPKDDEIREALERCRGA